MAFPILLTDFLWFADLKWFAYIYGGVCAALSLVQLFRDGLGWVDWILWLGVLTPMGTCFLLLMVDMTKVLYIKANWYFSFFTYCVSFCYTVTQTVLITLMVSTLADTPSSSDLNKSTEELFAYGSWAHQAFIALPEGFRDVAFFHEDDSQPTNFEPPADPTVK